ncbi:hypothetical protein ACFLRN_03245 [Thermoproteota archaeon]
MGFSVVCHGCEKNLYEGSDMIPIYRLRKKTNGRCPDCGRKLSIEPLKITCEKTDSVNNGLQKIS